MLIIETIAVISTLVSIFLTIRGNILCWPIGIVGIILYSIIFFNLNIIGYLSLQFVFLIQSVLAWRNWANETELKPTWIIKENRGILVSLTIILYMLIFITITKFNSNLPFLDSVIVTLSIIATFLLIKKKIESWIYWILNDILLIIMFLINGLYLSSFIYFVFLILALFGLNKWIRDEKI